MRTSTGQMVLAVVVLVAVPLVTASTCQAGGGAAKACDVLFGELGVREGLVVGTVHAACDPRPQSHLLKVVMETAVGDRWIEFGRAVVVDVIPDASGFDTEARAECREGRYRLHVHVEGAGPTGSPFVFDDTSPERSFALVECAG